MSEVDECVYLFVGADLLGAEAGGFESGGGNVSGFVGVGFDAGKVGKLANGGG